MTRLAVLLACALALSGCAGTGVAALSRGLEVAEIRIARITTYNNARLERCLALVRELDRVALNELEDAETPEEVSSALNIADIATKQMDRCRPELLIERAKKVLSDGS